MAAIRSEELLQEQTWGELVAFPTAAVRRRVARQARITFIRRRIAVGTFLVLLVVGLLAAGGVGGATATSGPRSPRAITVAPGDTLWGIAHRYGPEGDVRAYVDELIALNGLAGAPAAGMRLRLPR